MPTASVNGVEIYYEETGQGAPLVFSHEFGGDHRSWEGQVRYFSRRYRVVAYTSSPTTTAATRRRRSRRRQGTTRRTSSLPISSGS